MTDAWGNITYSLRGSAQDQALVPAHEKIHQILTPRLYPLRRIRVQSRMNSYVKSSLSRYLEEALAETAAQVQVKGGLSGVLEGIKFPVSNGYVFLRRVGNAAGSMGGRGVAQEGGSLIGIRMAAGLTCQIRFSPAARSSTAVAPRPATAR